MKSDMKKIMIFVFGLFMAGLYLSFLNDCWSYLEAYTPPSDDVFYNLMMFVWNTYPYLIMLVGLFVLLVSAKAKSIMEADE